MFYDRFIELCNRKGVKPTRAALEAKISKSLVSKWKNNISEVPSMEVLEKLARYFNIPVSDLLTGGLIRCHECGLLYDSDDFEEREHHRIHHAAREKAILYFGFCWSSEYRDTKKAEARSIIDDDSKTLQDRLDAQIVVFKSLFSRSLTQNNFDLDHPKFDEYVAMILNQGKGKHSVPEDLYDLLVSKYGTKDGISDGTYYYTKKRVPHAKKLADAELPNYYKLTEENRRRAQEYIDLLLNSQ